MSFKQFALRQMRRRFMQPAWEALGHLSLMGRNHWATLLQFSGELKALEDLARIIPQGGTVFDVGANSGEYAVAVAGKLRPAVIHAFEPSGAAHAAMIERFGRSNLESRVQPHRLALGSQAGTATLHSSSPGSQVGSLVGIRDAFEPFVEAADEAVPVATIDGFCAEHGIASIDLLKIDVEGFELEVLRGSETLLRAGAIKVIQFEFGVGTVDARVFLRDFFDLLGDQYAFYRIVSDGLWPIEGYSPELEQCVPINYLAIMKSAT